MIESSEQSSADTGLPVREYKFGDVVFANHVILRQWQNDYDSGVYVIAVHGQIGVVQGVDENNINVNFHGQGEAWIKAEDVNLYRGHVVRR